MAHGDLKIHFDNCGNIALVPHDVFSRLRIAEVDWYVDGVPNFVEVRWWSPS
jgi:hypothetical protein